MLRGAVGAAPIGTVLEAVRGVDPYGVVSGYRTMGSLIADSVRDRRAVLVLMATFSTASVLLGCIGIFGITAHGVRSRMRELGIRIAMGASGQTIVRHVMLGGLRSTVVGVAIGLGLALLLTRYLESFLYEVASIDAVVVATAAGLALGVSCLATWLPARRAALADPVTALHAD